MPQTDPLALRHGAFISHVWSMIAEARHVARAGPSMAQCATQLRRLRYLRRKVLATHRIEMQRHDASTPAIDGWFKPLEDCLDRAEAYFCDCLCTHKLSASMAHSHAAATIAHHA